MTTASGNHERIGPTGHYTAHVWRRMGLPHAETFATLRGRRLFWTLRLLGEGLTLLSRRVPSMEQHLGHRHLLIDCQLRRLAPDCLVELGAGLSPRGVEWAADRGVRAVELDLPHMASAKQRALARAPAALRARLQGRHRVCGQDVLAPGFAGMLGELIAGAQRPAVVTEGVLGYFDAGQREQLARAVAAALRGKGSGGAWLCDLYSRQETAELAGAVRALRVAIRVATRGSGINAGFADEAAIGHFFEAAGFDAWARLDRADFLDEEPRLRELFSPATVYCATVQGGGV